MGYTDIAALAEFERDIIRERTAAGLAAARAQGRVGGRPPRMTPDRIQLAQRMVSEGTTVAQVARTLGVGRTTLYAYLGA